jgi:single-strand DNA-binding protein
MSLNVVLLLGHLTRDPELRYTPNGAAVAQFGLGVNRRWKNGAGELQESPVFVEVVAWGKQAETVATYLTKGRPVVVEGRLQLDQWETEAGERRSRLKVVANRVTFLGRGARVEAPTDGEPPTDGQPQAEALPDWVTEEA